MTKHVCKISHLNYKRLLRKLQKTLGGYFILPHPVCICTEYLDCLYDIFHSNWLVLLIATVQACGRENVQESPVPMKQH